MNLLFSSGCGVVPVFSSSLLPGMTMRAILPHPNTVPSGNLPLSVSLTPHLVDFF